jgi:hypothetical protein
MTICIYLPVHTNYSQVEHVAAFFEQYRCGRVFTYSWSSESEKMRRLYESYPGVVVEDFSNQSIVRALLEVGS